MFESVERVTDGGAADTAVACAAALADGVVAQRRVAAERLAFVARWADLHHPDAAVPADATPHRARTQRVRFRIGAEGTPEVSEYAATELGMLLQTTTHSAQALLRDALELRHRMPLLWEAVMTGRVEDWKARKVVGLTRVLSAERCRRVDEQVLEAVVGLPFGRALAVVEGKVVAADPAGHELRRAEDARRQYVGLGRKDNPHGLRTLIARGQGGDMVRLWAQVDHLAALLGAAGNTDPVDVRRATALAMLADPARTCLFLADTDAHSDDDHDQQPRRPVDAEHQAPTSGTRGAEAEPASAAATTDAATSGTTTDDDNQQPSPPVDGEPATKAEPALAAATTDAAVRLGELLSGLGPSVLDRLRPVSVLHLHLAAEAVAGSFGDAPGTLVARSELLGALSIAQLQEILGTDRVTVKPVLDPLGVEPVDAYEIPMHLRESITSLQPFEVFPYGTTPSRSADLDHTMAYDPHGPPGQTRRGNLGPLGRHHHRAKTFGGFTVHQPVPGLYLWRTPTGHWYQVDHTGTTALGTQTPDVLEPRPRVDTAAIEHLRLLLAA